MAPVDLGSADVNYKSASLRGSGATSCHTLHPQMNHNCLLVLTATLFLLFSVTVSLHRRVATAAAAAAAQLLFPAPPGTLSIIGSGSETVTHHFPHLKLQKITFSSQKTEVCERAGRF